MEQRQGHDIIVIGASAGGIEPLRRLTAELPRDLPAAVFVVLHIGVRSHLAHVLGRSASLPVVTAESGEPFRSGRIYVAGPGRHLLLHDRHVLLRRGPRENMARPAIDPLFRTAAVGFGGRVIGVVLSGALSDGTAGLRAIKRCGGLAVVQDPEDAAEPSMPLSALRHVDVDQVVAVESMGALLARLSNLAAGPTPHIPLEIRLEATIAAQELPTMETEKKIGTLSPFTCPECGGALWEIDDGSMLRFRCHVGHAYTAESMLTSQSGEADRMLETLIRSHRERAVLVHRMAAHERSLQNQSLAAQLDARAIEYEDDMRTLSRLARHCETGAERENGEGLTDEAAEEQG